MKAWSPFQMRKDKHVSTWPVIQLLVVSLVVRNKVGSFEYSRQSDSHVFIFSPLKRDYTLVLDNHQASFRVVYMA